LDILNPVVNVNPESYLEPTGHSFSLQIPRVDIVSNIFRKLMKRKPPVLADMIPSKLLKMAAYPDPKVWLKAW